MAFAIKLLPCSWCHTNLVIHDWSDDQILIIKTNANGVSQLGECEWPVAIGNHACNLQILLPTQIYPLDSSYTNSLLTSWTIYTHPYTQNYIWTLEPMLHILDRIWLHQLFVYGASGWAIAHHIWWDVMLDSYYTLLALCNGLYVPIPFILEFHLSSRCCTDNEVDSLPVYDGVPCVPYCTLRAASHPYSCIQLSYLVPGTLQLSCT